MRRLAQRRKSEVHGERRRRRRAGEILLRKIPTEFHVAGEAVLLHEASQRIVFGDGASDEEQWPASGLQRREGLEYFFDSFRRPHDSESDADRPVHREAQGRARLRGRETAGESDVLRNRHDAGARTCVQYCARDERGMGDDRLRRANHARRHRERPWVEIPDGHERGAPPVCRERLPARAVRALELTFVVRVAAAREVGRREKVVEHELVEDHHGRSPPAGIEERFDGRQVEGIVPDLEEQHVVAGRQRLVRLLGRPGPRLGESREGRKQLRVVVRDSGTDRRERADESDREPRQGPGPTRAAARLLHPSSRDTLQHVSIGERDAVGMPSLPPLRSRARPDPRDVRLESEPGHLLGQPRDLVSADGNLRGERVGKLAKPSRVRDDHREAAPREAADSARGFPHRRMAEIHGEVRGGRREPEVGVAEIAAECDVVREPVLLHEQVERIVVGDGAAHEEERPARGRQRGQGRENPVDPLGRRHDAERDGHGAIRREAKRVARLGALRARGRDHVMRDEDGACRRVLPENRVVHELRVGDDGFRRADDARGHRERPGVLVPHGSARAPAATLGKSASPGAVRPLELSRVVVLAPPVEVRRGEKMVKHEIVEDDDGGRPPACVEERLDGGGVQRVVSELEEKHVVRRDERPLRLGWLVGNEGKRILLRE